MSVRGMTGAAPQGQVWTRTERVLPWSVLISEHPVGEDDTLSLAAAGTFARICALAPATTFDAASLAAGTDSPATVEAALDELAARGYLAEVAR
ncbi:hypothetical protein ACFRR7_36760 [Streptomyces sp. NPDC056909]|uniref:hypothetical protein n=1 Tax=Streptomyces sp. NPDC056909 TaxID=3345963 RepID=UPI0036B2008C